MSIRIIQYKIITYCTGYLGRKITCLWQLTDDNVTCLLPFQKNIVCTLQKKLVCKRGDKNGSKISQACRNILSN